MKTMTTRKANLASLRKTVRSLLNLDDRLLLDFRPLAIFLTLLLLRLSQYQLQSTHIHSTAHIRPTSAFTLISPPFTRRRLRKRSRAKSQAVFKLVEIPSQKRLSFSVDLPRPASELDRRTSRSDLSIHDRPPLVASAAAGTSIPPLKWTEFYFAYFHQRHRFSQSYRQRQEMECKKEKRGQQYCSD